MSNFNKLGINARRALKARDQFSIREFAFILAGFEPYYLPLFDDIPFGDPTPTKAGEEYLQQVKLYENLLVEKLNLEKSNKTIDMDSLDKIYFPHKTYMDFCLENEIPCPLDWEENDNENDDLRGDVIQGVTVDDIRNMCAVAPQLGEVLRVVAKDKDLGAGIRPEGTKGPSRWERIDAALSHRNKSQAFRTAVRALFMAPNTGGRGNKK